MKVLLRSFLFKWTWPQIAAYGALGRFCAKDCSTKVANPWYDFLISTGWQARKIFDVSGNKDIMQVSGQNQQLGAIKREKELA